MVKNPSANAGDARDTSSVHRSGRFPGEGNGNPLEYYCVENPMDIPWTIPEEPGWLQWGHKESDTTEQHTHTHTYKYIHTHTHTYTHTHIFL